MMARYREREGKNGGGEGDQWSGCIRTDWFENVGRAQELYESQGGRPGLPSLINLRFLRT